MPTSVNHRQRTKIAVRALRALGGAALGVAWVFAMWFLAILVGAAGHGSFLPMAMLSSPFWAGFALWPCVFMLVAIRTSQAARALAAGLMFFSYVCVPWAFPGDSEFLSEVRRLDRFAGVVVAAYLVTQIALWWRIVQAQRRRGAAASLA